MNDALLNMASNLAGKALDNLIESLKEEVGESYADKNVQRVAEIGLSLASTIGKSGLDIVEAMIEGRNYDERVLANNLSLREMSDLLDILQNLEADQKASINRVISVTKNSAIQASSILIKAVLSVS